MAQDRPTAVELIEAVTEFLRNRVMPELEGHAAFHARVAANALDIVRRELELGSEIDAAERQRLLGLLAGTPEESASRTSLEEMSTKDLNRELCRRIRSGAIDIDRPDLRQHLERTARDKLSIDNPRYATYRRLLAREGD